MQKIRLNWKEIGSVVVERKPHQAIKVEELLQKYYTVFKEDLGPMQKFTTSLHVKPGSRPSFVKPDLFRLPGIKSMHSRQ